MSTDYTAGDWIGEDDDHVVRNHAVLVSSGDGCGDCVGLWSSGWESEDSNAPLRVMLFRDGEPMAQDLRSFLRLVASIPLDEGKHLAYVFCTTYQGPDFELFQCISKNEDLAEAQAQAARDGQAKLVTFLHDVWNLAPMPRDEWEAWSNGLRGNLAEEFNAWIEKAQDGQLDNE